MHGFLFVSYAMCIQVQAAEMSSQSFCFHIKTVSASSILLSPRHILTIPMTPLLFWVSSLSPNETSLKTSSLAQQTCWQRYSCSTLSLLLSNTHFSEKVKEVIKAEDKVTKAKVTPAAHSGVDLQGAYAPTQTLPFHWKDFGEHYLGPHAPHPL